MQKKNILFSSYSFQQKKKRKYEQRLSETSDEISNNKKMMIKIRTENSNNISYAYENRNESNQITPRCVIFVTNSEK